MDSEKKIDKMKKANGKMSTQISTAGVFVILLTFFQYSLLLTK